MKQIYQNDPLSHPIFFSTPPLLFLTPKKASHIGFFLHKPQPKIIATFPNCVRKSEFILTLLPRGLLRATFPQLRKKKCCRSKKSMFSGSVVLKHANEDFFFFQNSNVETRGSTSPYHSPPFFWPPCSPEEFDMRRPMDVLQNYAMCMSSECKRLPHKAPSEGTGEASCTGEPPRTLGACTLGI